MILFAQFCDYAETHLLVNFTWVIFMECELYLNTTAQKIDKHIPHFCPKQSFFFFFFYFRLRFIPLKLLDLHHFFVF